MQYNYNAILFLRLFSFDLITFDFIVVTDLTHTSHEYIPEHI